MHTTKMFCIRHQLLVEELAIASIYHNVSYSKGVSAITFYTKQTLPRLGEKVYYGICETTFKLRYANHKKSFNHRNRKLDTNLSNEFWRIKGNKNNENLTWETLGRHQTYSTSSKRCSLCCNEKLKIASHRNNNMLKRRIGILNKCRKKSKYALTSHESKD